MARKEGNFRKQTEMDGANQENEEAENGAAKTGRKESTEQNEGAEMFEWNAKKQEGGQQRKN